MIATNQKKHVLLSQMPVGASLCTAVPMDFYMAQKVVIIEYLVPGIYFSSFLGANKSIL